MFLEIKSIEKYYGTGENRTKVLKGITTEVEKGKICVLLGPSGSGKSTLLNIIGGIEKADGGSISIDGSKILLIQMNFCILSACGNTRIKFRVSFRAVSNREHQ